MFEALSELLRHDPEKIRRMLGVFERVTREDVARLDAAFVVGDRGAVRALAHRMKSACLQIGEQAAGHWLATLEQLGDDTTAASFEQGFRVARNELDRVLARVEQFLSSPPGSEQG